MTQSSLPPHLEGSHAPNPLELFWDKHRRTVTTILTAAVFGLLLYYGIQYYQRQQTNATWSEFAATALLDKGYVDEETASLQFAPYMLGAKLVEDLADADATALKAGIDAAKGTNREPWLLWLAARKSIVDSEWDEAESYLERLQAEFPDHSLCVATDYPVQFRENVEKGEDEPEPKPGEKPELVEAQTGSMVDQMRVLIGEQKEFTRPTAFDAVAIPADAPKVRFKFADGRGEFVIALFAEQAPEHVKRFLDWARMPDEGEEPCPWIGMRVDEVHRRGENASPFQQVVEEFHIGLPGSKQADRTQWVASEPSEKLLDFEYSSLSMFPGTVSGRTEADGKSSAERFWINVNDAPHTDGQKVVFGRVVEGLDVLDEVILAEFATTNEDNAGRGKPTTDFTIESVTVEVDLPGGGAQKEEDPPAPPKDGEKPDEKPGDNKGAKK